MLIPNNIPQIWTSSSLELLASCPYKYKLIVLFGWSSNHGKSIHLDAGGVLASAFEATRTAYYLGNEMEDKAIAAGLLVLLKSNLPMDGKKSLPSCIDSFLGYWKKWPLSDSRPVQVNGKNGIEFSFSRALTDEGDIFFGRADALLQTSVGSYITDEKSCSSVGADWGEQWKLRAQFIGYAWATATLPVELKIKGVNIRGLRILPQSTTGHKSTTSGPLYPEAIIPIAWKDLQEEWLRRTLHLIEVAKNRRFYKALGEPCNAYGGCQFKAVCYSRFPEAILRENFHQAWYNPMTMKDQDTPWWTEDFDGEKV
jgi:hypothetical protein